MFPETIDMHFRVSIQPFSFRTKPFRHPVTFANSVFRRVIYRALLMLPSLPLQLSLTPGVLPLIYDESLRFHIFLKLYLTCFLRRICDKDEFIILQDNKILIMSYFLVKM